MLPPIVYKLAKTRSLLPVTLDKVGMLKWRELQQRRMEIPELREYTGAPAWAHITGQISGLFTIDIDAAGMEWCSQQALSGLAHRETPGGGLHIDVVLPRGWLVKNTAGALAKGVDTRGEGGIALIWGKSRKGRYNWLRPIDESPMPFGELPQTVQWSLYQNAQWVEPKEVEIDFSQPPASREEIDSFLVRALARAPLSGRNAMGFWLACRLRDSRVDKEVAKQVGYEYAARVFSTNTHGLHENYTNRQVDAAVNNAYSRVGG